jgi:hypothetical protein
MTGADYGQCAEILDDIEEALDAQENLQGLFQTQMVAEGVRKRNGWQSILNGGVGGCDNRAT